MPALDTEDAVDTSSFDPEAYLAERDAGTSSTDGFDPEAYLAERDAQNVPPQGTSTDGFDPEAYLAERAGQKVAAANPDVAATTQAVATTPAKIDPAKNDKWNEMQARSNAMADEAGLPPAASARDRLIGAIQRSEAAGYPVKHFIGSPNEPTGDRGPTMDVENLVGALRQRAAKDPSAAKELAYWERDLAENGMTAEQWKQQTGEAEPGTPQGYVGKGEFAPEANVAPIVPRQPGQTSVDSFKKAMTEPAVTFEPIKIEQSDSELVKIDKTQQNLIKGFVSGATSPAGALALLSPFVALGQIVTSAPDIIHKLDEADKTPAGSPERHEAAAEVIATILPFAIHGMVKGLKGEKPKSGEPRTEPNPAEVPVTQPTTGEVAPESIPTEVAQPQTATEPRLTVEPETLDSSGKKINGITISAKNANGETVGAIEAELLKNGTLQVYNSNISPELRGQGHGVSLYEKLLQEAKGTPIVSDTSVSESAANVWESLSKRGVNVEKNPTATLEQRVPDGEKSWVTSDGEPVFTARSKPATFTPTGVANVPTEPIEPGIVGAIRQIKGETTAPIEVRTEDGFTFKKQSDGSWGDGDASWGSYDEMVKSLKDDGIRYVTNRAPKEMTRYEYADEQMMRDQMDKSGATLQDFVEQGPVTENPENSYASTIKSSSREHYFKLHDEIMKRKPTPAASGEPAGTGISNERLQEIYGDAAPVATTGKGPAEWKNIGQTRLEDFQKSGKPENDPATVLTNLREGKVPMSQVPHDVSLLRAEHQRLLESARKAEGTPEYEAKAQASLDMATAIKEVAHGPASDVFRALQEYDQPKYDNVTDFDQAVRERMGRETTDNEKAQFQKIADEVGKTRDLAGKEIEATQKKLQRFRGKEKMSFDDATKKVHEQIEQLVKDCIP